MSDLKIHFRFDLKYLLLYSLLLNCYRSTYADNKFKGKILVLCSSKQELMKAYDKVFDTIKDFKIEDIVTLKKFVSISDKMLKQLFNDLDNHNIDYDMIIEKIKKDYTRTKSMYLQYVYGESQRFLEDKNILFIELGYIKGMYDKFNIREIFVPEYIEVNDAENRFLGNLCNFLVSCKKEISKAKKILKSNNAAETEYLSLNAFINTDDGIEIADRVDRVSNGYAYDD